MFIFIRLLLAHFIADFPLQLSKIYNLKLKYVWGSFVHSGIVVLTCIVLCIPFLRMPEMWVVIFWIWLIHGLQDWMKVAYCEKVKKDNLWIFILDQLLHMGLISVVFLVPGLSSITAPEGKSFLLLIYNSDKVVIYAMGYIFAGFGGTFMSLYIKEFFLKIHDGLSVPAGKKKYYGIVERILIVTLIVLESYWFLLILLLWGVRSWVTKARDKKLYVDLSINTVIGIIIGLLIGIMVP